MNRKNIMYIYAFFLIINFVQTMELPPANIENPNAIFTITNNTDQDYTMQSSTMFKPYPIPAHTTKRVNIGQLFVHAPATSSNFGKGKELILSLDSKDSHKQLLFSYIKQPSDNHLFSGSFLGLPSEVLGENTIVYFNPILDDSINIMLDIQNSKLTVSKKSSYLPLQILLNNQSGKNYSIDFGTGAHHLALPAKETTIFNPREYLHGAVNIISFMIRNEHSKITWIVKIVDLSKDNKIEITTAIFNHKNERLTERPYILNPEEITEQEFASLNIDIVITDDPSDPISIESISEHEEIR